MQNIPVIDLKAQYQSLRAEVDEAVGRVLSRGSFILGEEVDAFEREFAMYCGVAHVVGLGSGTDALHLALRASGIGEGHEVIVPAHTAVAVAAAVELAGARPVLADIDSASYTLDPRHWLTAITPRTRAVIPVHLYGCPAALEAICEAAELHDLIVVEDCAQAHGARLNGKRVGSWGHIGAFSFYPTKNLGAYGDGGALVTDDADLATRVRLLRQYGWEQRYVSRIKGLNSRLDDIQAAVLRVKLPHLDRWNARRRELAALYGELLVSSGLTLPIEPNSVQHVYHQYVIRHPDRERLKLHLKQRGVQTLVHYPVPLHLQPAYQDLGYKAGDLPFSEAAARQVLSLPLYPELTEEAIRFISNAVLEF